ncbi:ATP-dependent helicase [Pasteurellaceae bacterium LFhippo2]|nr:ATP-dependent helicase [Pasteurellaceae bacterium LFhippo2]
MMAITAYQARYYANEISCRSSGLEGLSQTLFDAKVDLNPHQIQAALFALKNPLQQGVFLADEVGLGKTIEAALVLCQLWAERKRRLLIICPAVLSKQWETELAEKFALPSQVVDRAVIKQSGLKPTAFFKQQVGKQILILSHQFAVKCEPYLVAEQWDLVVIDEAHKFRNAHNRRNVMGQALRRTFNGQRKLLLTATPLQNSLMELYGLSTLLDEYLFGDEKQFRKEYVNGKQFGALRDRLQTFVNRTLRKQVLEYVHYTERRAITQKFNPTDAEQALYQNISDYLQRETLYALPKRSRHLTVLILRKLLASSAKAVIDTLEKILERLQKLQQNQPLAKLDLLLLSDLTSDDRDWEEDDTEEESSEIDFHQLAKEISEIEGFIAQAKALKKDSKALALLTALEIGFAKIVELGAEQKVIIFTESTRTQNHLIEFLGENGYAGKLVAFSGTNNQPEATQIYEQWKAENQGSERITGSVDVDKRTALIDYFRNYAQIMVATEAAAEGVNLQFCSMLINYDLPWNPQRVEQRIGRCHRYGQKFDVVVINFLNQRNAADRRVLTLLEEKFKLFNGVFGASDEVLGKIENGVDVEQQILDIYQKCRTEEEIKKAFDELQKQLTEEINQTLEGTKQDLFNNFDQEVLAKLKTAATERLNQLQQWVWGIAQFSLEDYASFNHENYGFWLNQAPQAEIKQGYYHLLKKENEQGITFRLNQPIGEWCLSQSLSANTPLAKLLFSYQPQRDGKVSLLEQYQGQSGWLRIDKMTISSEVKTEERLIFTAMTEQNKWLDDDFCRKLLMLPAQVQTHISPSPIIMNDTAQLRIDSAISQLGEENKALIEEEIERLEQWAKDKIGSLEIELEQLGRELDELKSLSRKAQTLEEQQNYQQQIRTVEKERHRKRRDLFDAQDEIIDKRDELINQMMLKLKQSTRVDTLFVIGWDLS